MRTPKPRLASGNRVVVDVSASGTPGLGSPTDVVTTSTKKEALPRRAARSLVGYCILGAVLLFLTYVVLATTVFVVMRADNHYAAVLRSTFPVGQAPSGAVVYASSAAVDHTLLGKAKQAALGVPAGSVVEIVAGPIGTVSTNPDGYITVNNTVTEYQGDVAERTLTRQYVAICVAGACQEGAAVIVEQGNIVGEVKGYVGLDGLTEVSAPQ